MSAGSMGGLPPEPPETEMGIPVDELRLLEMDVPPRFLLGVHNRIERRRTTGQVVSFSWNLPAVILTEMLGWVKLIQELFSAPK
jgi:hypothetical protein